MKILAVDLEKGIVIYDQLVSPPETLQRYTAFEGALQLACATFHCGRFWDCHPCAGSTTYQEKTHLTLLGDVACMNKVINDPAVDGTKCMFKR